MVVLQQINVKTLEKLGWWNLELSSATCTPISTVLADKILSYFGNLNELMNEDNS